MAGHTKESNSDTRTICHSNCCRAVIHKELSYIRTSGSEPLSNKTIGQLFEESAKKWPRREFLVSHHQNERLTYEQVLECSDKIAAGLKKLGLKRGDRVAIYAPNDNEWCICFIAILRAGFITVNLNPFYKVAELQYCLEKVQTKAVIAPASCPSQDYVGLLLEAKKSCSNLKHIIVYSSSTISGVINLSEVESLPNKQEIEAIKEEQSLISSKMGCNVQFTSGTTGKPKATLLAHVSFVNNSRVLGDRFDMTDSQNHKICINVPLFHIFGLVHAFICTIRYGATLVLSSRSFSPLKAIEAVASERCTIIFGTPTMWALMIDVQLKVNADLSSLKLGISGGAAASPQLINRIRDILHLKNIKIGYGLTETTAACFICLNDEDPELTEITIGFPVDNIEIKVIDRMGQTVPLGVPGELCVKGYTVFLEYCGDVENTKKAFTEDHYFKTGDQIILREDGYAIIVGRLKDMLIRGGENIFPKEIEDFLESHPAIMEAHVFGAYDEVYGEEICACIRLAEGKMLTKEDVKDFALKNIAKFKVPKYIVFRDDFPKTASGKIQKYALKEELEDQGVIPKSRDKI